jgi:hypothetical protein
MLLGVKGIAEGTFYAHGPNLLPNLHLLEGIGQMVPNV